MSQARPTTARQPTCYDLGPVDRIPVGEGRTFQVAGREIAVFRGRDGRVLATQAGCPHRGGRLADGLVGDGKVICPLHAYRFDLATGRALGNDCARLATYRVSLTPAERIILWLDHRPPEAEPAVCP